ncbi:hypothetical protein KUTeg_007233 [Tegillarca granosa]|uniref:Glycosyl transferase family 3 domain-containing protein n=1 Tax=Tegillarca granosa TaxID=220873 RepID=A0ABQ9FCM7_TEGGR|nr:hypothetical protein KUTeg_007233 [Tegillarca granosa]
MVHFTTISLTPIYGKLNKKPCSDYVDDDDDDDGDYDGDDGHDHDDYDSHDHDDDGDDNDGGVDDDDGDDDDDDDDDDGDDVGDDYDDDDHDHDPAKQREIKVPMVSGRGLAHTGGTLDKLEAIPGFTVSVSADRMQAILDKVGCCIVGQTSSLVPADKKMYAIRDVTATVDHDGLIAASIISKKAAERLNALVLDVKCGKGAFYKCKESAGVLAKKMVAIGNGLGIKTVALLTRMDVPIGRNIGNALEVAEAIQCLHGNGPRDVIELVINLGGHLLYKCGKVTSLEEGCNLIKEKLDDESALRTFTQMIQEQGVEPEIAKKLCNKNTDVRTILPKAKYTTDVKSLHTGDTWVRVHHEQEVFPADLLEMLQKALDVKKESLDQIDGNMVIDVIS